MPTKIKTCIVGNMKVGKSSIIIRIFQNTFKQGTMPTVGVDYRSRKEIVRNQQCLVQLWDTTGQQKFKTVVANFFRQSNGVFIVFDMTDDQSLLDTQYWLKQLDKYLSDDVPRFLLANKSDLRSELSDIARQKVKQYCQNYKLAFFKVSAKKNTNIKQAYDALIESAYENAKKTQKKRNKQSIFITNESQRDSKHNKKGCC